MLVGNFREVLKEELAARDTPPNVILWRCGIMVGFPVLFY